jgi:hydroxymethylpyrimidine/phosphomethylpyrimidine kinase
MNQYSLRTIYALGPVIAILKAQSQTEQENHEFETSQGKISETQFQKTKYNKSGGASGCGSSGIDAYLACGKLWFQSTVQGKKEGKGEV